MAISIDEEQIQIVGIDSTPKYKFKYYPLYQAGWKIKKGQAVKITIGHDWNEARRISVAWCGYWKRRGKIPHTRQHTTGATMTLWLWWNEPN